MTFFGLGKKKDETETLPIVEKDIGKSPAAVAPKPTTVSGATQELSRILTNPRITEKATVSATANVYVFDISDSATKHTVAQAVFAYYKVRPRKIRIVTIPSKAKRSMHTGIRGTKHGGKKAYVYLKKGEVINPV